ncbi:hypothetical protein AXF42_Ash020704 [Apostasia shenzhenica]|uniref:Uncharacterized protein n=1 Tax=Apostasia shenzhenica TaxID=1088818 RepID=A0A2H9ZY96_9ASPA|nr:hypothetical protein AXF42_Ash020704 [Apostasia shenzhenica]
MLKNMKGEVEKKIADNSCEKPKTNCQRSETSNNFLLHHNDAESCSLSYNTMISDGQSNYQTAFENKNYIKVSKMEQELEVELHRLEILNLEDQESVHPHQDKMEVESETSDERLNEAYQEVNNEAKEEGRKHGGGVCPRELERRLRDLLEARQQERIAELENALECAERKLHDKEMEVCWWRDTARLVSKHSDDKIYMQF